MKEQIKKLKQELKQLAVEIRELKSQRKSSKYGFVDGLYYKRYYARHKHIAYCLLRGVPYEKIEQPHPDNKPVWAEVDRIIDRAKAQAKEVEDEGLRRSA